MTSHAILAYRNRLASAQTPATRSPRRHAAVRAILRAPTIQPKLTIGAVNDPAEREADRVADQVMQMPAADFAAAGGRGPPPAGIDRGSPPLLHRKCAACEADEAEAQSVVSAPLAASAQTIRRLCPDCEAGRHAQLEAGGGTEGGFASPRIEAAVASLGPARPLPAAERAFFEPRFGRPLDGVRIHDGPQADVAARSIQARAFALGKNIALARGAFRPGTESGRRLLAHELAHVTANEPEIARRQPGYGYYAYPYYGYGGGSGAHPCPAAAATPSAYFCAPFPTRAAALADRDDPYLGSASKGIFVLAGTVAAAKGSSVAARLYVKFIYGGSGSVESANDGVADFTSHATTAFVTTKLVNDCLAGIVANRGVIYAGLSGSPGSHIDLAVDPAMQRAVDDQSSDYALNYCGLNLPGVIAGGIGKTQVSDRHGADPSAARNDSRNVTGDFRLTATPQGPAQLHIAVEPRLSYHLVDTVDFCPGNPGGFFAEFLTLPMSRWEASGISGDVTFQLDFPPPRLTGSVILESVNGTVTARGQSVSSP